jgi:hypothetical protein
MGELHAIRILICAQLSPIVVGAFAFHRLKPAKRFGGGCRFLERINLANCRRVASARLSVMRTGIRADFTYDADGEFEPPCLSAHTRSPGVHNPEAFKQGDFDPDDAIEFWDMVNRQDWHVCALSQRGIGSTCAS